MIVHDAESCLAACLESARGAVQEMVIADIASADRTVEIARGAGARVLQIPWNNDFSEARNRALAEVRANWVLWLDADEQLDSTAVARLPLLLNRNEVAGYQVPIRNYLTSHNDRVWYRTPKPNDSLLASSAKYPAFVEQESVRLFRRDRAIYFVGRVQESVEPRIREMQATVGMADFRIHHFELAVDEATRQRKYELYRELGHKRIAEFPNDWRGHFELGVLELEQFKNLISAQVLFSRACQLNPNEGVVWFLLGVTVSRMGYFEEGVSFLTQAEQCGYRTALVSETRGDGLYNVGQFKEAVSCYETALKDDPGNSSTVAKLCLAIVRTGQGEEGLKRLRSALAAKPRDAELHEGLVLSLVSLDRIEESAEAAERKLKAVPNLLAGDYLRAASLWAQVRNWGRVSKVLERGLLAFPNDGNLSRALGESRDAAALTQLQVI